MAQHRCLTPVLRVRPPNRNGQSVRLGAAGLTRRPDGGALPLLRRRRTTGRATAEPPGNTMSKAALSTEPRETPLSRGGVQSEASESAGLASYEARRL